jgi:hypothetical protein
MVDACLHADQRAALEASAAAARNEATAVPASLQGGGQPAAAASPAAESTGLGIAPKN